MKNSLDKGSPNYSLCHLVWQCWIRPASSYQRAFSVFFSYIVFSGLWIFLQPPGGSWADVKLTFPQIYTSQSQSPFHSRFFPFPFWVKIYLKQRKEQLCGPRRKKFGDPCSRLFSTNSTIFKTKCGICETSMMGDFTTCMILDNTRIVLYWSFTNQIKVLQTPHLVLNILIWVENNLVQIWRV